MQAKLKRLVVDGYVQRIWLPRRAPAGSSPALYTLARKGCKHLRGVGLDVRLRSRPSEQADLSYLFLSHTAQLNDFLIGVDLFCRALPRFRQAALLHERDLKRHPIYVEGPSGKRSAVIPDAWLDIRLQERFQVALAVELDRGTEQQKRWRQKVANLIAFAGGPYQEAFGSTSLTVTVVTTAGERRLLDLLRWTEAELGAVQEESQGDIFLFTSFSPDSANGADLLLSRRWVRALSAQPCCAVGGTGIVAEWASGPFPRAPV